MALVGTDGTILHWAIAQGLQAEDVEGVAEVGESCDRLEMA
jgi:hypothetical protein